MFWRILDGFSDCVANGFSSVAGESRTILLMGTVPWAGIGGKCSKGVKWAVGSTKVPMAELFRQGSNLPPNAPERTTLNLGATFADHDLIGDKWSFLALSPRRRPAQSPSRAQASDKLTAQRTTCLRNKA